MTARSTPSGFERTLLWLVTAFRVFGAAWMVLLGVLVLTSNEADHPGWVVTALIVIVLWTMATVALALRVPWTAATWGFVIADIAISVFSVWVSVKAVSILFAGGFPLAAVFASIYAKGTLGGALAAAALTVAAVGRLPGRPSLDQPNSVSAVITYVFSAAAAAGAASVLRSNDARRVAAEEALATEQAARARADERADVAAHLHDSVLQTLALIQRDSTATDQVRGLARSQERELRSWLYRADEGSVSEFREAVTAMAAEVDELASTHVECVIVGDSPMNERVDALVRAGREATLNAAKHAGVSTISVYAEAGDQATVLFVKDRGVGFDTATVPPDRRGIADSIVGRVNRYGGSATITSAPGQGTEVRLTMPAQGGTDE
ncbi:MAG: ATP-binding protein [bacterium]|nr:ATP-binding protein [bacterium]